MDTPRASQVSPVEELAAALQEVDAPLLRALRPGLTAEVLKAEAKRTMPQAWVDGIDEEIVAWFSWQNGVDPDRVKALEPKPGSWSTCGELIPWSPLASVSELGAGSLDAIDAPEGILCRGPELRLFEIIHLEQSTVFPIAVHRNDRAADIFLRKKKPGDPWTVWNFGPERGMEAETGDPTFQQWTQALANAIRNGWFTTTETGGFNIPDQTDPMRATLYYPWQPKDRTQPESPRE